jgi:hypothetical protein
VIPRHWSFGLPQRHSRSASEVLQFTRVRGGHAATFRRLLRLGPWGVCVVRYRSGDGEEG